MKIEAIPNKGPASLGPEITECFGWANNVYIASAFLTLASLKRIEDTLIKSEKSQHSIEILLLVGLYQRFTSAKAIKKAFDLQKKYPSKFRIQIARNSRFHWKLYIFGKGTSRKIYIGSANFTEDGLTTTGELSIKITAQANDQISKSLQYEFEEIWKNKKNSFQPNENFLNAYNKLPRPLHRLQTSNDNPITKLLRPPQRVKEKQSFEGEVKSRLVFVEENFSDEAIEDIKNKKNSWNIKNWNYICFRNRNDFEHSRNSKLIILVKYDGSAKRPPKDDFVISINQVEDSAEFQTADGKYFVAFSRIPYSKTLRYGDKKEEFKDARLFWNKLNSDRFWHKEEVEVLCKLLHLKYSTLLKKLGE